MQADNTKAARNQIPQRAVLEFGFWYMYSNMPAMTLPSNIVSRVNARSEDPKSNAVSNNYMEPSPPKIYGHQMKIQMITKMQSK